MDSQQQFQRDYEQLSLQLMGAAIDDANHFYAIRLSTEKGERRLLDLILDCLEKKLDLEDSLSLAEWLCKEDGSLIVKSAKANPVYKCLAKGLFLTNEALKIDLESLLSGCHSELIPLLNQLVFHLGECHPEQLPAKETINRLRELYASRFRLILDKELDYLRMQKGANQLWIALAQTLAGAGLIDANYYRFLIPTLKPENDNELLSGDPVTYYPLSHYILAENGSYLIFLGNCVQQHIARRAFLNCSVDPPSRLTIKERQRLIFAAAEYVNYFLNQVKRDHSPPLLKSTVDAVRDLVNGSVYNQGLYANRVLDWATQTRQVMASYDSFRKFYNQLPAEERHNLNAQSISRDFEEGTFEEYFDQIWGQDDGDWEKENECTSSFGQAFVKLVTDYSHKPFKKELEDSKALNLEYMRSQSKKGFIKIACLQPNV